MIAFALSIYRDDVMCLLHDMSLHFLSAHSSAPAGASRDEEAETQSPCISDAAEHGFQTALVPDATFPPPPLAPSTVPVLQNSVQHMHNHFVMYSLAKDCYPKFNL